MATSRSGMCQRYSVANTSLAKVVLERKRLCCIRAAARHETVTTWGAKAELDVRAVESRPRPSQRIDVRRFHEVDAIRAEVRAKIVDRNE